jgi:hypothetical protein
MEKQIAIAIDFGTSNSGAAWGEFKDNNQVQAEFVHKNGGYAKTPTFLLIKKSLAQNISRIADEDIETVNQIGSNVYFGHEAIDWVENVHKEELEGWVIFDDIKMNLYKETNTVLSKDGNSYDIIDVISLYIRCLKVSTLKYLSTEAKYILNDKDIDWGITIPAIWSDFAKDKMEKVAYKVFGDEGITKILEPEGASVNICNRSTLDFKEGDTVLVADCGGGTTDIIGFKVHKTNRDNLSFEEVVHSDGIGIAGTDMDKKFWYYYANKISENSELEASSPSEKYEKLLHIYWNSDIYGQNKIKMQKALMKFKHDSNFTLGRKVTFVPDENYIEWISINYPKIYEDNMKGKYIFSTIFSTDEIIENVFNPVIHEIRKKINEMISSAQQKGLKFNYIFGAGGLMGCIPLRNKIREEFETNERKVYFVDTGHDALTHTGGAIMDGAMYMLINGTLMTRVAKRTYYTIYVVEATEIEDLINTFKRYYGYSSEYILQKLQQEKKYFSPRKLYGKYYVPVLAPICIKDKPFINYSTPFVRIEGAESKGFIFDIYSTNAADIFFLPGWGIDEKPVENSELYHEAAIEGLYDDKAVVIVSIDFNQVPEKSFFTAFFQTSDGAPITNENIYRVGSKRGH